MARLTRSSYIKISLIILLCLVICGTLTGGFVVIHNVTNSWRSSWDIQKQAWLADSNVSTGSFMVDASDFDGIAISWLAGKVTVDVVDDAQTGGKIQVSETEDRRLPLRWRNADGQLEIDYGDIRGVASCSFLNYKGKDLEVLVPESAAAKLGSFVLDAASGEYRLNGLECRSLEINQASGDIQIDGFSAESASFEIASGRFGYDGKIEGSLAVDMASGNAQLNLSECNPKASNLTLASGELKLMLPVPDFRVELSRMSGSFNSDFELLSKGDMFYCVPDDGESIHDSDDLHKGSAQALIDMDMMSGNFFIGRS